MNYPNPHAPGCPWYDITVTTGAPNIKWCEQTLCQWISEPANTWSNISYLIIALIIAYISFKNKHNHQMKQFGPIIFFMGMMSLVYHLSNFYGSQILDFIGMFSFVGWTIGMNLIRMEKLNPKNLMKFNIGYSIVNVILVHVMYMTNLKFQSLILIAGIIIVITEFMLRNKTKVKYGSYFTSLSLLIIAFGFSISDGKRIWCHPDHHGWFSQGHAMWHWTAGLAMIFIYLHYAQAALKPQENR